jgi:hypothetical protein
MKREFKLTLLAVHRYIEKVVLLFIMQWQKEFTDYAIGFGKMGSARASHLELLGWSFE